MGSTVYVLNTNGIDHMTTYTSRPKALKAAESFTESAEKLSGRNVITVRTQKTGKEVYRWETPESVTVQGDHVEAPDAFAHMAEQLADKGGCDGLCELGTGCEHCDTEYGTQEPQTDAESVSPTLALVRAVQGGAVPVAGVIQDRPGNVGITHYHAAACADVKREMQKWGQSEDDVIRFPFSSVAEIIEFEFSDVENGEWEHMLTHATDALRIMPCLSNLPAGRTPNGPLVTQGGLFREGFDRGNNAKAIENGTGELMGETFPSIVTPVVTPKMEDFGFIPFDDGGFVETLVTKEYHLSVCVDEITCASVDLGWHTFTLNAAQAYDLNVIADAYGKAHGTGKPRYGWASVIGVTEICDI